MCDLLGKTASSPDKKVDDPLDSKSKFEFLKDYHASLTDNLNHISDDLLKAKWFFLATVAAIGTAYIKIAELSTDKQIWFGFIAVCLIGNIIFWLISEYTLSHAFLFRFIQSKLAKIEEAFDVPGKIKDPTSEDYFIKEDKNKNNVSGKKLETDYIIPDQFVPIYWASTWFIIINTIIAINLDTGKPVIIRSLFFDFATEVDVNKRILIYLIISLPLIWKLWTYYCYKLDKFVNENCKFKILTHRKKNYFEFPNWPSFIVLLVVMVVYVILKIAHNDPEISRYVIAGLIGYFWPVMAGLLINILRTVFRFNSLFKLLRIFTPSVTPLSVRKDETDYIVSGRFFRILAVLYNIT